MEDDLEKRMKKAGMLSISEMMNKNQLGKFSANAEVVDMDTFEQWLDCKHEEMLSMKVKMMLDKREDDELYEWVFSHEAVLNEVRCNLRSVKEESKRIEEANIKGDDFFQEPQYIYDGDHSYNDELVVGGESLVAKIADAMSTVEKVVLVICIIYAIYEVFIQ